MFHFVQSSSLTSLLVCSSIATSYVLAQETSSSINSTSIGGSGNLLANGNFDFQGAFFPAHAGFTQTVTSGDMNPWFFSSYRPASSVQNASVFINSGSDFGQVFLGVRSSGVGESLIFNSTVSVSTNFANRSSSVINIYAANQIVNATSGAPNYTLSLWYAKYYTPGSAASCPLHTRTLQVFVNGNSISTLDPDDQPVFGLNWIPFTVNFTLSDRKAVECGLHNTCVNSCSHTF